MFSFFFSYEVARRKIASEGAGFCQHISGAGVGQRFGCAVIGVVVDPTRVLRHTSNMAHAASMARERCTDVVLLEHMIVQPFCTPT